MGHVNFLSFDCATKTLGWAVARVRAAPPTGEWRERIAAIRKAAGMAEGRPDILARLVAATQRLDDEVRKSIEVLDAECADLVPGRSDADVGAVERVKALNAYLGARVDPVIDAICEAHGKEDFMVLVEYQIGAHSHTIADAILSRYHDRDIRVVGPSLKNKIHFTPELAYRHFVPRYAQLYTANKAHTKKNVQYYAEKWEHELLLSMRAGKLGHVADSIMQVLGYLAYGNDRRDAF